MPQDNQMSDSDDRPCVNCQLVRETDKAWCITCDGDTDVWVPKSQGELYKLHDGTYNFFAKEWLLKAKGLI